MVEMVIWVNMAKSKDVLVGEAGRKLQRWRCFGRVGTRRSPPQAGHSILTVVSYQLRRGIAAADGGVFQWVQARGVTPLSLPLKLVGLDPRRLVELLEGFLPLAASCTTKWTEAVSPSF